MTTIAKEKHEVCETMQSINSLMLLIFNNC